MTTQISSSSEQKKDQHVTVEQNWYKKEQVLEQGRMDIRSYGK